MPAWNDKAKQGMFRLGVLIAPIALVQGARLFDAAAPGSAPAATVGMSGVTSSSSPSPPPEIDKPTPISEPQRRAMVFLAGFRPRPDPKSPMDRPEHDASAATAPVEPASVPAPPTDAEPSPLTGVSVGAIIGRGDSAVALIRHQVRHVGDEIAPGWRIQSIDPRHRCVVAADSRGRTVELRPPSN